MGDAKARKILVPLSVFTTVLGAAAICLAIQDTVMHSLDTPFETWSLAIGLFLFGAAGLRYNQLNYHGGAFSIFGAFLALLAFFDAGYFVDKLRMRNDVSLEIELAVFLVLAIPAGLLLWAGKMHHDNSTDVEAT